MVQLELKKLERGREHETTDFFPNVPYVVQDPSCRLTTHSFQTVLQLKIWYYGPIPSGSMKVVWYD